MPVPPSSPAGPRGDDAVLARLDADLAARRAEALMRGGLMCSEAVFQAVGEQLGAGFDRTATRLATGFGGGIGRCRDEVCGALSGGVMLLGLLYGRETAADDSGRCLELTLAWREAFRQRFGASTCRPIYDRLHGPGTPDTCAPTAGEAAGLFVTFLTGGTA
jgi:C_GCAxxG_C_C family probable redox protein